VRAIKAFTQALPELLVKRKWHVAEFHTQQSNVTKVEGVLPLLEGPCRPQGRRPPRTMFALGKRIG
jgi:hypothetical protein